MSPAVAQIGGKTAADGIFVLEDVEDLDLVADGVERAWIPDFVAQGGLSPVALQSTSLTLAQGQSPIGALLFDVRSQFGFIDKSFGVPMPSVPGQSSLPYPGNIVDFSHCEFLLSFSPTIPIQQFWLILETYPERSPNVFPRMMWRYYPVGGSAFQRVSIPLHEPTLVLDGEGLTTEELLSKTRFMSFYFYAQIAGNGNVQFKAYVDDIVFVPSEPDPPQSDVWMIYGPTDSAAQAATDTRAAAKAGR